MSLFSPGTSPRLKGFPNRKPEPLLPFSPALVAPEWGWFHSNLIAGYPVCNHSLYLDDAGAFGGSHLIDSVNASVVPTIYSPGVAMILNGAAPSERLLVRSFDVPITIWALMRMDGVSDNLRMLFELHLSANPARRFAVGFSASEELYGNSRHTAQVALIGTDVFSVGDYVSAILVSRSLSDHELYQNGVSVATSTANIGVDVNGWDAIQIHSGRMPSVFIGGAVLSTALNVSQIHQLVRDPFGPFRTSVRPLFLPAGGIITELTPSRYAVERFYLNS